MKNLTLKEKIAYLEQIQNLLDSMENKVKMYMDYDSETEQYSEPKADTYGYLEYHMMKRLIQKVEELAG